MKMRQKFSEKNISNLSMTYKNRRSMNANSKITKYFECKFV